MLPSTTDARGKASAFPTTLCSRCGNRLAASLEDCTREFFFTTTVVSARWRLKLSASAMQMRIKGRTACAKLDLMLLLQAPSLT